MLELLFAILRSLAESGSMKSLDVFNGSSAEASVPVSPRVQELVNVLPRVLIVSRRHVRKNKFVDFVGEYHLDLIVRYGAVPVIVPRVKGVHNLIDSFEPIHGEFTGSFLCTSIPGFMSISNIFHEAVLGF